MCTPCTVLYKGLYKFSGIRRNHIGNINGLKTITFMLFMCSLSVGCVPQLKYLSAKIFHPRRREELTSLLQNTRGCRYSHLRERGIRVRNRLRLCLQKPFVRNASKGNEGICPHRRKGCSSISSSPPSR